jgi:endonuclease/exonuclease/phosphatase family metal-dependent hydrolase
VSSPRLQWAVGGFFAAWAVARLTAADRFPPLERAAVPLLSLTPQVAAGAGLAALALRRPGPAATAALAGTALAATLAPRVIPSRRPPAGGPVLRVLTINMHYGKAAGPGIVGLARRLQVDVLFLQELGDDGTTRLKDAGLSELLPHMMDDGRTYRYRGSAIYSRYPLREGLAIRPSFASQPTARLDLPGGQAVQLVCVHPHPPFPPWVAEAVPRWRAELETLPSPGPEPGDLPIVLAGDYNSTLDHAEFRRLLRRGYVDAASQAGRGLAPTWGPEPTGGRPALLAFDHVVVDPRCAVLATSAHLLPGSDHRGLYAALQLPATTV